MKDMHLYRSHGPASHSRTMSRPDAAALLGGKLQPLNVQHAVQPEGMQDGGDGDKGASHTRLTDAVSAAGWCCLGLGWPQSGHGGASVSLCVYLYVWRGARCCCCWCRS